MFFIASKLLWFLAAPSGCSYWRALIGVVCARWRAGRALAFVCLVALLLAGAAPLGALLLTPLEDRFPAPAADLPPPYGIIILGGAIDDEVSRARGQTIFDEGAARLTEAAILARRYPMAKIVYTGGSASLLGRASTEADEGRKLLIALGVEPARIEIEPRSRNTDENARFTAALLHPAARSDLADRHFGLITCRARWACSARPASTRSPIRSTTAPRAAAAIGGSASICRAG